MTGIFSQVYLLGNALQFSEQNHQVLSKNIANFNTPGYHAREVSFEEFAQSVQNGASQQEILQAWEIRNTPGLAERVDGNNVDLDQQVAALNKNFLAFQTYSHLLAAKLAKRPESHQWLRMLDGSAEPAPMSP